MKKMTKTLEGYLNTVIIVGCIGFLGGLFSASFFITQPNRPEDWSIYYFPFKMLGAAIAYIWLVYWFPGGNVTFHFNRSTATEDEKTLNDLILKYRNKKLLILPPIIYIIADLIFGFSKYQKIGGNFDGFFASIIISFWIVLGISGGLKFISAWWNIRKNLTNLEL